MFFTNIFFCFFIVFHKGPNFTETPIVLLNRILAEYTTTLIKWKWKNLCFNLCLTFELEFKLLKGIYF